MVGGLDAPFRVVLFDWDPLWHFDYIGEVTLTLRELSWPFREHFLQNARVDKKIMHYAGRLYLDAVQPMVS
jgi:hypothetical protein